MRRFDVVVIGAGPAGLSAAAELSRDRSCLLIDRGPLAAVRDRGSPQDLLSGVGGAGLFSDGKHSFFPSATALWQLPDREALAGAFDATAELLQAHGVDAGALPTRPAARPSEPGTWHPKHYPAIYVPFVERLAIIQELWAGCADRWSDARVTRVERAGDFVLQLDRDGRGEEVRAPAIVIATGRWSSRWIRPSLHALGVGFAFRRFELGVRIEVAADHALFAKLPGVDGKLVLRDGALEIRTFCTCRDGEVVLGESDGLRAYSGRADGPRTGRSNVGLLIRGGHDVLGIDVERMFDSEPAQFALAEWLANGPGQLAPIFGDMAARAMWTALERLLAWSPELAAGQARVFAPVIEGIGDYPVDDGNLQLAPGVWIAGDAGGRFRGIVASMISGRYVARRIIERAER